MSGDQSKSEVDQSSSKSDSVLGREEGFGSVPFKWGSNLKEGSSYSHSHVMNNNLQEHQRLMMLRSQGTPHPPAFDQHVNHKNNLEEEKRLTILHYHHMMQHMTHTQHTDPSINTVKARVYPPGSRFLPTDLGCVRVHLRNKVDKDKGGFITTLDLYKDDPWLLDHVQNDLFLRGEWYYFTPRTKRGSRSCNRSVGGRGGGTWKTTSAKEAIKDREGKVQGYKQSLVYNKTDVNGDVKQTGWNMTEYCLHKKNQDDLVLCHLKGNLNKKGFVEEVNNNMLSNQVQDHKEEGEAGANGVEMRTLEEDHGDVTQQQQQEQDAPPVPVLEGQGLGVETMMTTTTTQNNDQNLMTMLKEDHGAVTNQQQQQRLEQDAPILFSPPYEGQDSRVETRWNMQNDFMTTPQINHGDATQQQQQLEQDAPVLSVTCHESQDLGFETMMTTQDNNNNNLMTMPQEDHGDATQQQQDQDAPPVPSLPSHHEGQDSWFETTENYEDNFMRMLEEDRQNHLYDPDFCIDFDELFDGIMEDDVNEGHLQQPVSQARDAIGGSSDQVAFTSD